MTVGGLVPAGAVACGFARQTWQVALANELLLEAIGLRYVDGTAAPVVVRSLKPSAEQASQ